MKLAGHCHTRLARKHAPARRWLRADPRSSALQWRRRSQIRSTARMLRNQTSQLATTCNQLNNQCCTCQLLPLPPRTLPARQAESDPMSYLSLPTRSACCNGSPRLSGWLKNFQPSLGTALPSSVCVPIFHSTIANTARNGDAPRLDVRWLCRPLANGTRRPFAPLGLVPLARNRNGAVLHVAVVRPARLLAGCTASSPDEWRPACASIGCGIRISIQLNARFNLGSLREPSRANEQHYSPRID